MIINHTTKIEGELEIDHERGVIYFHPTETGMSLLRLSKLPTPIPPVDPNGLGVQYEITGCRMANWQPQILMVLDEAEGFPGRPDGMINNQPVDVKTVKGP